MQEDFLDRSNRFFAALAGWSYDHRGWVLGFALVLLAGSLQLASQAQIDNSFEAYFDSADSSYREYLDYRDRFGSDETSYIVYGAPEAPHGPWNMDVMRQIVQLTEALENEVPFIYEVQSLANAELMIGREDGVEILELQDEFPETQAELLALRQNFLDKPIMVGGFLNEDASHAAIIIRMDRTSTDPLDDIRLDPEGGDGIQNLYPQVTHVAIEEILARPEYQGIDFYHTGDVPLNALINIIIDEESATLGFATAAVVALVLLFFFRSIVGVLAPTAVVQLGLIMTVAFMTLVGWKMDLMFGSVPTLMTAIGVAHSVHILSEFRVFFAELGDRREALVSTLRLVGTPALLSSVTTAVGFGSMSFAPIKSIAHMGTYSAFGVLAIFVLSLTLLMSLLSFGPRTPRKKVSSEYRIRAKGGRLMIALLLGVHRFVIAQRVAVLVAFAFLLAFAIVGVFKMKVDANWINDYADSSAIKQDTLYADSVMGGVAGLTLLFDAGSPDAIKNPEVMQEITRIEDFSNQQPLVAKSYSIGGILRDLNQTFNEGDPNFYTVPESRDLIAQYMILYEGAGGTDAARLVSSDYQTTQLELRMRVGMTSETVKLVDAIEEELAERPLEHTSLKVTGVMGLWLRLLDYIVISQVRGFLIAFCAIGALLCLVFRSIRIGSISMLPNVLPALLILGVMGWAGLPLDYNKVAIAAVAMGIAVDDTVHLLSRFRYEFRRLGNYEEALRAALLDVGRALTITSITLVLGFLVLTASMLASRADQGFLLAGAIVIALVADFFLMPALVLTLKPFGRETQEAGTMASGVSESVSPS